MAVKLISNSKISLNTLNTPFRENIKAMWFYLKISTRAKTKVLKIEIRRWIKAQSIVSLRFSKSIEIKTNKKRLPQRISQLISWILLIVFLTWRAMRSIIPHLYYSRRKTTNKLLVKLPFHNSSHNPSRHRFKEGITIYLVH